jgi:hypothetical protein
MNRYMKLLTKITVILLSALLLTACPPSHLQISSITHDPEVPSLGQEVAFIITFRNNSQSSSYSDVIVNITQFDEHLEYRGADPQPDREDTDQHIITWYWGN